MSDDFLDDLLPDFIEEAEEHLQTIEGDLLQIERDGVDVDLELVNKVFRGVHSIKGAAGFLGLETIGDLSHALESLLDGVRQSEIPPLTEVVEALLSSADVLRELVEQVHTSNERNVDEQVARLKQLASGETIDEAASPAATATPEPAAPASPKEDPATDPKASAIPTPESTVRVAVGTLDKLMNLAGELVLGRNRLMRVAGDDARLEMKEVAHRINQVTSELQESVLDTRMQPVGNVFSKFPRVVRDLCKKLNKEAELVLSGEEVDLDRSLIEAMGDPLTHLVRNSVDHGIEAPAERVAAGKNPRGKVELSAFHQGGMVHISIKDDGKGIDPDVLRKAAISKGVITEAEAQALDDREAVNLIFRAGFSTAEEVTDVSGRGVGMDVVRTNLEALSSTVEIDSAVGRGSTITIKVPLTLAIMAAVIVSSGGQSYAIPQANVRELVAVRDGHRIESAPGGMVLRLRGSLLPLVRLEDVVGAAPAATADWNAPTTIVVVDSGTAVFGICIERHPNAEEIVVKPLGEHLCKVAEFGGATILGDGSVALILDINGIATQLHLRRFEFNDDESQKTAKGSGAEQKDSEKVVLFSGHEDELFALPLPVLSRIERIPTSSVQKIAGRYVWERAESIMPLIRPQDVITAREMTPTEHYMVLVTTVNDKEVGILAPQLGDILESDLNIDPELREPGVFGSFQHESKVVRLLDIAGMFCAVQGNCLTTPDDPEPGARILFAEDSKFFREQTGSFLVDQGMQVTACEDGQAAWQVLESGKQEFDIILTDIEMPRMSGLEFTRKIKADPRFAEIPVIALSSLSSDSDLALGREAGIDEYQVKLDKQGLLGAIARYMKVQV